MEVPPVFKSSLIFAGAVGVDLFVLVCGLRREVNTGGCGPRALLAVAAHLGSAKSEAEVLKLFPGEGFETSLEELEGAVPRLRLVAQCRNMSVADLRREHPLGVLHVDEKHFVAVVGYEEDSVLIVDPLYKGENEPVRWLWGDLRARWDGAILVVSKR